MSIPPKSYWKENIQAIIDGPTDPYKLAIPGDEGWFFFPRDSKEYDSTDMDRIYALWIENGGSLARAVVGVPWEQIAEHSNILLSRKLAQDRTLTFEARGMMAYMLSQSDDWKVEINDLCQNCGRDRVYRILNELIERGYVHRTQIRDDSGQISHVDYDINQYPDAEARTN